jgi:beta-lactamase class A
MLILMLNLLLGATVPATTAPATRALDDSVLDFTTPVDRELQSQLEQLDKSLRDRFDMQPDQAAVGLLDLNTLRLAMIRPDAIDYAASVPKIGILLAYFATNSDAADKLDPTTRHELGLMIKLSDNDMAAKYSRQIGLKKIQQVLDEYHFYDKDHGGGIWVGKHYGKGDERYGDPIADHSHAATVRQLLRYYLLLNSRS